MGNPGDGLPELFLMAQGTRRKGALSGIVPVDLPGKALQVTISEGQLQHFFSFAVREQGKLLRQMTDSFFQQIIFSTDKNEQNTEKNDVKTDGVRPLPPCGLNCPSPKILQAAAAGYP